MAIKCGQIPTAGQSVIGSALTHKATGPGPNQAAEAALCLPSAGQVYLISKVGGDPFAEIVKSSLKEFKVNTDFVFVASAKNTGVVVTMVNAEGENAVCQYLGANSALQSRDIEIAELIIANADVCLIHGALPHEAIVSALRCAELYGTKVILNPARPMEQHGSKDSDLPIEYFSADILIPNLQEAADITEQPAASIRTAKLIGSDLVARGAKHAIITMGRRGCMVVDRDGADHIPAFDVDLVDQTGSGDAFAGALAAYYTVKNNVREAAKFASAAGALACTKFGSIEAMPTRAEIIQLLQREDIDLLPGSK
jgi:ribokinase